MINALRLGRPERAQIAAAFIGVCAVAIALAPAPMGWALAATLAAIPFLRWLFLSPSAWLNTFLIAALLAPPLPIARLHPAAIVAAVGLIVGFLRFREWRVTRLDWTIVARPLVAFIAIVTLSVALAAIYSGPDIAGQSLARAALAAICVYVFLYTCAGPGRLSSASLPLVYVAALAAASFACFDFYYQFPTPAGFESQFVWLDSGVFRRAQGLFYEAGTLGNFCAFFLILTIVAIVRRAGSRLVLAAGAVIFSVALIFSYSRSSALNLLVALGALVIVERSRLTLRRAAFAAAILLACAVLGYEIFPAFISGYWTRLWLSAGNFFSSTGIVLGGRLESWTTLTRFLAQNPWHAVLGVGYKTLPYSNFIGEPVVADNMYLSTLVETGIVGLAALLALNFAILRASYRAASSAEPGKSFYATVMFCFWCGETVQMLSADILTFWRLLPIYFWTLAMALRK